MAVDVNISKVTSRSFFPVADQKMELKKKLNFRSQVPIFSKKERVVSTQLDNKRMWVRLQTSKKQHLSRSAPVIQAARLATRSGIVCSVREEKEMLFIQRNSQSVGVNPLHLSPRLNGKHKVSKEKTDEELIAICALHHLNQKQLQKILDYVQLNESEWEQGDHDIIYVHKLHSGLPRAIFWIRGEGVFVKLTGQNKSEKINEACQLAGLNLEHYKNIKITMNQYFYHFDQGLKYLLPKKRSGLPTDVLFHPVLGLFIRSVKENLQEGASHQGPWVKVDLVDCKDPESISSGTFKHVVKGVHLRSGKLISIGSTGRLDSYTKCIIRGNQGITDNEMYAIKNLDHPNIQTGKVIEYPGTKIDPQTNQAITKRALLSPLYAMGDLLSCMRSLNTLEKTRIAVDLMEALVYLHAVDNKKDHTGSWVHFDIKPDNIFVERRDDGVHAVLGDLGFAGPVLANKDFCGGSYPYLSPEMCSRFLFGPVGTHSDVWSAGVTLYLLFCGNLPVWADVYSIEPLLQTFYKSRQFEENLAKELSGNNMGKLLIGMLRIRSDQRLSASQCLDLLNR